MEKGIRLIDTAEMYGGGHAEELVGLALRGVERDEVFVITKVPPEKARRGTAVKAALASSRRLGTYIDLYLLHWPSLKRKTCEAIWALEEVVERGLARFFGVSNFTLDQLVEAEQCVRKHEVAAVENYYSLAYRRDEGDVIPYALARGIMYIAYTPLEKGALARDPRLVDVGKRVGATAVQVALAWYRRKGVVPIPKAEKKEHIDEIAGAMKLELDDATFELVSRIA